ncbi:hypothetical protein Tco_1392548 [Tanacetum coccineum]
MSVASMYQTSFYVPKLSSRGSVQCCSLPPEETSHSLPPGEASYSLPPEETSYSLPPEGTSYFLPPEETGYSLPPEGASHSLPPEETLLLNMHTYVSRLKDNELETLIATYDIPLDLRPRLPDPNFRMINLSAEDTAIGIYSRIFDSSGVRIPFSSFLLAVLKYFKVHISQLVPLGLSKGDWFSFAKRGDHALVCIEVAKSGLKFWKEKFFLIDRRAIPFHMPWRHPDSCITDKVPTSFNQNHVDQLKAHIMKLHDIPEGVLVRSGLSRVWRNPMCDPVLRRSDNTVMSIYDFLCMPSLDKVTVREEPHRLETSILGRVADSTTSPDSTTSESLACIRLCLMCQSCLLGAACKSLACIRLCPRGQSCLHTPSTGRGSDVCDIRTSVISVLTPMKTMLLLTS